MRPSQSGPGGSPVPITPGDRQPTPVTRGAGRRGGAPCPSGRISPNGDPGSASTAFSTGWPRQEGARCSAAGGAAGEGGWRSEPPRTTGHPAIPTVTLARWDPMERRAIQPGSGMRREHRLRRGADVQRVRASHRSWSHPLLVCYASPRADQGRSRVAIIASRRVGKAVIRNRVKRRLREAVRGLHTRFAPGLDVVLIARPAAAEASYAAIEAALARLAKQAGLLPASQRPAVILTEAKDPRSGDTHSSPQGFQ